MNKMIKIGVYFDFKPFLFNNFSYDSSSYCFPEVKNSRFKGLPSVWSSVKIYLEHF